MNRFDLHITATKHCHSLLTEKKKVLQQEPLNMSPYKYNLLGVKNDIYVDTLEIFP